MRQRLLRLALSTALVGSFVGATAGTAVASSGSPGDAQITVPINDARRAVPTTSPSSRPTRNTTATGTPVYVYVPEGALGGADGVHSLDPAFDHNPGDEFVPCADAGRRLHHHARRRSTTSATS